MYVAQHTARNTPSLLCATWMTSDPSLAGEMGVVCEGVGVVRDGCEGVDDVSGGGGGGGCADDDDAVVEADVDRGIPTRITRGNPTG